ncbi:hypothetical protein GGU11DRAFT_672503 [Lentinula aff. detonsa]|uniref:protein-tyrosine-phosphatase n=1 Tax=Lentinula aff. detonsa TaxID=2804958 RepID=A0AA38NRE7_9AGAR|nr:hypothetical protein GGU10DRAFT_259984 [Lentinula aff. detonsa]KAJ3802544.1 hypothetical protein GGU11DRAFT_672503 [Lentinula aff. detonsa]
MNAKALAPTKPNLPLPSSNFKPSSSFGFVEPKDLLPLINSTSALIIDIRPHAAYSSARIPTALSLSVPSTLLKRPLFSLDRLGAMLPSSSARARFTEWPKFATIVVYDVDSTGSPFLPEGSNILGLLRKFSNDVAYSGNTLLWLKGGFQRVWRECRDLVDFRLPEPETEDDSNESGSLKTNHLSSKAFGGGTTTRNSLGLYTPRKKPPSTLSLRVQAPQMSDKPSVASSVPFNPFFDTIRQNIELTQGVTERIPLRLPKRVRKRIDDLPFEWLREISRRADVKPEDSLSSDGHDSTSSESHPHSPESSCKVLPPALLEEGMEALATQFYHIELAEQKRLMGVMKHHSAESGVVVASRALISESDSDLGKGQKSAKTVFPYSITAGVEKGAKNRYRHIWPFEHARVRLHLRRRSPPKRFSQTEEPLTTLHSTVSFPPSLPPAKEHDDYVNASYVQPLCTTRRYIATQGPLEATFVDFWTLVYQQNVHVIVMLTREIEGSMVKCGPYWKDEVYGPLRLQLISIEGNVDEGKDDGVRRKAGGGDPGAGEFFFSTPTVSETKHGKKKGPRDPADAIIKRTFLLSHVGYPDIPPRKIIQFQYLEWPDMNVPDDPRGVLGLIREVDQANVHAGVPALIRPSLSRRESDESLNFYTGIANDAIGRKQSPVLLHCSAGVGRTGGFIAVDAVLDGIRRELRKKKPRSQRAQGAINTFSKLQDAMQVDEDNKERAVEDGQGNWNCIDVSDQTGSHGSAFRVNEAMRHMYSQDRLSEWDVPSSDLKVQSTQGGESSARTSSRDLRSLDVNVSQSSRRSIMLARGQDVATIQTNSTLVDSDGSGDVLDKPAALPSMFPLSSVDSASSSDDSYGFQSEFKGARHHRSGHHATGSLSYGETALTSSTGTSFSSLQSLSGSAMPKSTSTQVIGGDQLSALNSHGEEARLRTLSAPSARYIQADAGEHRGARHQAPPFTSSPLVLGDRSRAVEKSPSPFSNMKGIDRDESASLPPPSRSLSPNNRADFSSASDHRSTPSHTDHAGNSIPRINSTPTSRPSNLLNSKHRDASARDVDHLHAAQDVSSNIQQRSVDLSYPRPLHNDHSPKALSTLEEPLMEVLQDMREQRMSLCQSLRQYVFVHAAVIEGALMIVDEEREREKKEMGMGMDIDTNVSTQQPRSQATPSNCEPSSMSELLRPQGRTKGGYSITSTPSTGKRVASPTELPKEDRKGDQMLFKRPSIKKKPTDLPSRSTRALEDGMV